MGELAARRRRPLGRRDGRHHPDADREEPRPRRRRILFDNVPGYPKGFRTLYGQLSSIRRIALTLGLPLEHDRKVDIVQRYHERMQDLKPLPPREVKDGPILENVLEGDAVDVLKFPVPRHHELDTARFIGTADCVITQDPDDGWFNLGAYRSQVYDGKTVGCQITEGKHGRIHRDKYFERGEPMKVVDPVRPGPAAVHAVVEPAAARSARCDFAGGLRGEPIDVVRGPYTGFPIPGRCRDRASRARRCPGQVRPEGPFGEWMGYYSDDTVPRPYVDVKTILYRNDPILTCAPQHKPVDETGLLKGIAGAAQIWRALDACGIPDVLGVWNHEAGPATRFTAIQIRQRYPGHARNALHIASNCQGGAYAGKWTVVVDEDVDAGDLDQVLWAMCTRFDPVDRHRPHPEGLGVEARSAVSAGQFQQPHPGRRLHPLRQEAQQDLPDRGRRQRRPAARSCAPSSRRCFRGTRRDMTQATQRRKRSYRPARTAMPREDGCARLDLARSAWMAATCCSCGCHRLAHCSATARRPERRGFLSRQDRHARHRLQRRRRLRSLCAAAGAPSRQAHPRAAQHRRAEPRRRRQPARDALSLQCGAEGRHRHRHVLAQHGGGAADRPMRRSMPRKFTWLGSISTDVSVCMTWHTSPIKTFDDMLAKPFTIGGARRRRRSRHLRADAAQRVRRQAQAGQRLSRHQRRRRSPWSAARSTACAACPGAPSRPGTCDWVKAQEGQHARCSSGCSKEPTSPMSAR